jgi:hypothetical protein
VNLRELADLRERATPGPWDYVDDGDGQWCVEAASSPPVFDGMVALIAGDPFGATDPDGPFIAAAGSITPEQWRALADVVSTARSLLEDSGHPDNDPDPLCEWGWLAAALAALREKL